MNIDEIKQRVFQNQDNIVKGSRAWNNSMGHYSDSLCCWDFNDQQIYHVSLGIDVLDWLSIQPNEKAVQAFNANTAKKIKQFERQRIKESARDYAHYGPVMKYRLALFLHEYQHDGIIALMKVRKFKSKFRESLAKQVIHWLNKPPQKRHYHHPLSPKQLSCLQKYG